MLSWFTITYLNFFLIQILVGVAHFFDKTTFWLWFFMLIYTPLMLVYNVMGNIWVRMADATGTCIQNEFIKQLMFAYLILTYTICVLVLVMAWGFLRSM